MSGRQRLESGIRGLDELLSGGFIPERAYMATGGAGTGKTILGLHFLAAGVEAGENVLFVTFEEDPEDIASNASELGFDTDAVEFLDLSPDATQFVSEGRYDVFDPDVVEGDGIAERLVDAVEAADPDRVFIDPLTYLEDLAPNTYQSRQEVAGLVQYLTDGGATVLYSSQAAVEGQRKTLEYLCDGSVNLDFASKGRTISVRKFRGSDFVSGSHTLQISGDGISVFPKLSPDAHRRDRPRTTRDSGVEALDHLLHGGIESATVTVVSGSSGVGKTTTAAQFAVEAAKAGDRSVMYLFEETRDTFVTRSETLGMPITDLEAEGLLAIEETEALSISPDQFAHQVRTEVEERGAEFVVIDGISGYRLSIRGEEDELVRELHALGRYLKRMGVTAVFIDDLQGVTGDFEPTSTNLSYLADNLIFLRYLEAHSELRKAIGVLKMRTSDFERTLREFEIRDGGIHVGEPLTSLRGILTGTPEWGDDPAFVPDADTVTTDNTTQSDDNSTRDRSTGS